MERPPPSGRWMTPSEPGEYTFCRRAWWYGRQERARMPSEAFERGLEVQSELQAAHLAPPAPRGFPWGVLAALGLVLVASNGNDRTDYSELPPRMLRSRAP